MKNKYLLLLFIFFFLLSCGKKTDLQKVYECESPSFSNLEDVTDVKNLFSIAIPKNWKTNLYFDALQTSIYSADTTKQLTETTLIDVTLIYKSVDFTTDFKEKLRLKDEMYQLKQTVSKELKVIQKPSYMLVAKGIKQGFSYQKSSIYIQINDANFLLAKVEVYGDSLIEQRFCKAYKLIDKIQLK